MAGEELELLRLDRVVRVERHAAAADEDHLGRTFAGRAVQRAVGEYKLRRTDGDVQVVNGGAREERRRADLLRRGGRIGRHRRGGRTNQEQSDDESFHGRGSWVIGIWTIA